jgi:hypothetical protein
VFNHRAFYANIQASNRLHECTTDFADPFCWKGMSADVIGSISMSANRIPPPLRPNLADPVEVAELLETDLRVLAAEYRADLGLGLVWDEHLSQLMSPFLAEYELEKTSGVLAATDQFQYYVRQAIPKGHTFKAVPIQFNHVNARSIMAVSDATPLSGGATPLFGDATPF